MNSASDPRDAMSCLGICQDAEVHVAVDCESSRLSEGQHDEVEGQLHADPEERR